MDENIFALFIPIISVISMAVMVILIVWYNTNAKKKRYELLANMYSKAIEHGQEVPKDLFGDVEKEPSKNVNLKRGIILIAVGIGISLFFLFARIDNLDHALRGVSLGIIPVVIGMGYLLIHFLSRKQEADKVADEK